VQPAGSAPTTPAAVLVAEDGRALSQAIVGTTEREEARRPGRRYAAQRMEGDGAPPVPEGPPTGQAIGPGGAARAGG
jgi:hypothetical protein